VFLDYQRDITRGKTRNNVEVLYAKNTANPIFTLTYQWEMGSYNDKYLPYAGNFINFLGTDTTTLPKTLATSFTSLPAPLM
jgi:hypothetical protein